MKRFVLLCYYSGSDGDIPFSTPEFFDTDKEAKDKMNSEYLEMRSEAEDEDTLEDDWNDGMCARVSASVWFCEWAIFEVKLDISITA